jgi:hypothetical protein
MRSFFLSIEALKAASTSSRVLFKFVGFILCPFFIYLLQKYEIISTRHVSFLYFLWSDDKQLVIFHAPTGREKEK